MGMGERAWNVLLSVFKMNERLVYLAAIQENQQRKADLLLERVVRLETMLELMMRSNAGKPIRA